jgi:hypothetical protein
MTDIETIFNIVNYTSNPIIHILTFIGTRVGYKTHDRLALKMLNIELDDYHALTIGTKG